jgi:outer membrane protein OmpA-like peptidoglycan-associated protein
MKRLNQRVIPIHLVRLLLAASTPLLVYAAETSSQDSTSQSVLSNDQIEQALQASKTHTPARRGLRRHSEPTSINLSIPFEYNSGALKPQASAQLRQLQLALTSEALSRDQFMVAGHTDAKGDPQYNKRLSLQRAESVKRFLVTNGVDANRMQTVGYGSEQLLIPDRPNDPQNRRVEIRDLGAVP